MRRMFTLVLISVLLVSLFVLAGCGRRAAIHPRSIPSSGSGTGSGGAGGSGTGSESAASAANINYGSHDYSMEYDGKTRTYKLHIPTSYDGSSSVPLLMVFHGTGGTSNGMEGNTKFSMISDQEGFIVVYPQALIGGNPTSPLKTGWYYRTNSPVDDEGFIRSLIDNLNSEFSISKIYATGSSNGAMFTLYLGYEMSEKISAIATVDGVLGENTGKSPEPIPIMMFNGKLDPIIPYNGREGLASVPEAFDQWAENNNCQGSVKEIDVPEHNSVKREYQNCDAETISFVINDGVHRWYAWESPLIWDFFSTQ